MPNNLGSFSLYPRGFVGATLGKPMETQPTAFQANLRTMQYSVDMFKPVPITLQANNAIEQLYAQYIRRSADSTSFEFRKKILIAALNAFGAPQFDFWYKLQFQSPVAGDLHARFLDDCLRFMTDGKREMPIETWQAILTVGDTGIRSNDISEYAKEFFGISSNGYNRYSQNTLLVEVIQKWCSQPNGIEDLLCSLHVLFGNV
jgi:hypothetical protein